MAVTVDDIVKGIDKQELVQLALEVCNIDSAGPSEKPVADYVTAWFRKEGFRVRQVGLLAERPNVLARLPGTGGGYSLIFNSHMDTSVRSTDVWQRSDPGADIHHKAWIEGEELIGEGIVNDKGPMSAFMIAAKAVKSSGLGLKGDLLLSAVVGETSWEPSDGPPGDLVETKDLGARFLALHGGVADYALIAEGTGFSIVTVEAGMAWYKVLWRSELPGYYTPYLPDRTTPGESPNMIVRAAHGVKAIEDWAVSYQKRYTVQSACGPIVPKAQVGAIKGGESVSLSSTPQMCAVYVGAFIVPGQDPLVLKDEIEAAVRSAGVPATEVECYYYHPGHEAKHAERIVAAVRKAHDATFDTPPPAPDPATNSMWRDINSFNEVGIPAITYGPRSTRHSFRRSLTIDSLYRAACVYARVIVDICNQEKTGPSPFGR